MKILSLLVKLLCAATLVGSAVAQIPTGTTSISFNGFCDGATITYSGTGSFISGTHDNYDCAGGSTFIGGVAAQIVKFAPGEGIAPTVVANMADNVGAVGLSNGAVQLYLDFNKSTFGVYAETGGVLAEQMINQGKFKIVSSPVTSGAGTAVWQGPLQNGPQPYPGPGYPSGTYDLYLNGYCDYFHVTTYGNRVGGIHDFATNCGSPNAPLAANDASLASDVDGTAGPSLVTTDNALNIFGSDIMINYYFNFAAGTWTLYGVDNSSGLFVLNSGTFTFVQNGPPSRFLPFSHAGLPTSTRF